MEVSQPKCFHPSRLPGLCLHWPSLATQCSPSRMLLVTTAEGKMRKRHTAPLHCTRPFHWPRQTPRASCGGILGNSNARCQPQPHRGSVSPQSGGDPALNRTLESSTLTFTNKNGYQMVSNRRCPDICKKPFLASPFSLLQWASAASVPGMCLAVCDTADQF